MILLIRGLLAPAGHAAWTGLVCAVAWRERQRAGHVVLNGAMVSAFLAAIVLHALWDIFKSLGGPSIVVWFGLELLSLVVALTSLTLLVRRVREARRFETPIPAPAA
jgi:protease PrsW